METLYTDLMGKRLIDALWDKDLDFIFDPDCPYDALYSKGKITWSNPEGIRWYIVLEEMIHALQGKNGNLRSDRLMNVEVEAKAAQYLYYLKHGWDHTYHNTPKDWITAFQPYFDNPSPENYQKIVEFVRSISPSVYGDTTKFIDNPDFRDFRNIEPLIQGYY